MKLIFAIVQDEDASRLVNNLMKEGFSVTKLATTGGFLRSGNTTLLLGVDDEKLSAAMSVIEHVCRSRKQMASAPMTTPDSTSVYGAANFPVEVTVGGATVFVMTVDQFVKL